ncbi:unnamed protein product [Prunus armeniaca]
MAATRSVRVRVPSLARSSSLDEACYLDFESPWLGPAWEVMLLLLVFFLGGIDEDNGLIPGRVANLCRGPFLLAAKMGRAAVKSRLTKLSPLPEFKN